MDSFDAITSERAYAEPIAPYEAIQEMYAATIDVFQRDLVEILIAVLGTYPVGGVVELSDGSLALVIEQNPGRRLLPRVIKVSDAGKAPLSSPLVCNLAAQDNSSLTVRDVMDNAGADWNLPDQTALIGILGMSPPAQTA